jgi:PIN domain nuclease of toxin-antitoxin system
MLEPKKLSREQSRVLRDASVRQELLGLSAVSLIEIGMVFGRDSKRGPISANVILNTLATHRGVQIFPITFEIAEELADLGKSLGDMADRAIVATARVERLKLVTADQRIIESELVPVIV